MQFYINKKMSLKYNLSITSISQQLICWVLTNSNEQCDMCPVLRSTVHIYGHLYMFCDQWQWQWPSDSYYNVFNHSRNVLVCVAYAAHNACLVGHSCGLSPQYLLPWHLWKTAEKLSGINQEIWATFQGHYKVCQCLNSVLWWLGQWII